MERTIGRLLRKVCIGETSQVALELRASAWDRPQVVRDTVDAAKYHGMLPLLAQAVIDHDSSELLRAETMKVDRAQVAHVLRLEELLTNTGAVLGAAGISFAAFKGAALAHGYYERPVRRTYVDVDLLVRADDLGKADEVLRSDGCLPAGPSWQKALSEGYGEVTYCSPTGTVVDLHWHPIRESAIRGEFNLNTSDLIGRTQPMRMGDTDVPVLDPEDMLVVVAAHACYDGAYRLGWLVDISQILRSNTLCWDVLAERCTTSKLGLPVQVMLDRARHTLRMQPDGPSLVRSHWRDITGTLTTVRPVEHTFGQVGRGGVIYRATRRKTWSSLASLVSLSLHEVAKPVLTNQDHRWRSSRLTRDRI